MKQQETYVVVITEKLEREVEVSATSKEDALTQIQDMYKNEEVVLSSDDFVETIFSEPSPRLTS